VQVDDAKNGALALDAALCSHPSTQGAEIIAHMHDARRLNSTESECFAATADAR
jgi:hypothetical protein